MAGVASFTCGLGQFVLIGTTIVPSISDLTLQGNAANPKVAAGLEPPSPWTDSTVRYADLRDTPAEQRGEKLMAKIVTDQVAGIFTGVWLGMLVSLIWSTAGAVWQTMVAGFLWRRRTHFWSFFWPYGELSVPGTSFSISLSTSVISVAGGEPWSPALWTLWWFALCAVALTGVWRGWPWWVRLLLYAALILPLLPFLFGSNAEKTFTPVGG